MNLISSSFLDTRRLVRDERNVPCQAIFGGNGRLEHDQRNFGRFCGRRLGLGQHVLVHEAEREFHRPERRALAIPTYIVRCIIIRVRRAHAGVLSRTVTSFLFSFLFFS